MSDEARTPVALGIRICNARLLKILREVVAQRERTREPSVRE